jgi:hypothetical protein
MNNSILFFIYLLAYSTAEMPVKSKHEQNKETKQHMRIQYQPTITL